MDIVIGDPISSVCLSDKYIIIGTMMGRIKLFSLKSHKIFSISDSNLEHISGISFNEEDSLLIASIGDDQILRYEISNNLDNNLSPSNSMNIHDNNFDHNYNCDNSYVLMAKNSLLKVVTFPYELEDKVKMDVYFNYIIIYFGSQKFGSDSKFKGKIKSTNFFVPLDFDGYNFCWVEYLNDKKVKYDTIIKFKDTESDFEENYEDYYDMRRKKLKHELFNEEIWLLERSS